MTAFTAPCPLASNLPPGPGLLQSASNVGGHLIARWGTLRTTGIHADIQLILTAGSAPTALISTQPPEPLPYATADGNQISASRRPGAWSVERVRDVLYRALMTCALGLCRWQIVTLARVLVERLQCDVRCLGTRARNGTHVEGHSFAPLCLGAATLLLAVRREALGVSGLRMQRCSRAHAFARTRGWSSMFI